jgi:Enhancer of rudimentary
MQYSLDSRTRNWKDFESYTGLVEHICARFEGVLKKESPNLPHITYNIMDLFNFVDNVRDFHFTCFHST